MCNHPTVAFGVQFNNQQAKLDLCKFSCQGTNKYYLVFGDTNWAVSIQFNFQRLDPELERLQEEWTRIMADLQDRTQAQSASDDMFLTQGSCRGDCFGTITFHTKPSIIRDALAAHFGFKARISFGVQIAMIDFLQKAMHTDCTLTQVPNSVTEWCSVKSITAPLVKGFWGGTTLKLGFGSTEGHLWFNGLVESLITMSDSTGSIIPIEFTNGWVPADSKQSQNPGALAGSLATSSQSALSLTTGKASRLLLLWLWYLSRPA